MTVSGQQAKKNNEESVYAKSDKFTGVLGVGSL